MVETLKAVNISRCGFSDFYGSPVSEPVARRYRVTNETPIVPVESPQRTQEQDVETTESKSVIDESLIMTLTTTADTIVTGLDAALPRSLQDQVDAWCALHGLDPLKSEERRTVLARQAVLALLLKATLYEWHQQRTDLPPLSGDARQTLRRAAERTGNPAFEENILDEIVRLAAEKELQAVIDERHRLLRSRQPAEDIGQLYETLTPKESRRTLGQFRTPTDMGTVMRSWASNGNDSVLDPGMGAGVLSSPFHPLWKVSTEPDHVTGIERSPFAHLMGTTALTLARQRHNPRCLSVRQGLRHRIPRLLGHSQ